LADLQVQRSGGSAVDWFEAVLGYDRTRVILASSMMAADSGTRFLVRGTGGSLIKRRSDPQEQQLVASQTPGAPGWGRDPDPVILIASEAASPTEVAAPAGNYPGYYLALRDALRHEGEPPVTPEQATTVMAGIEAGMQSAAEGCWVTPDYTDAERSAWRPGGK
jgi:predicted dehydrogenase